MSDEQGLLEELAVHSRNLIEHLSNASRFLVKCQIVEPYVERGTLYGCVCPWEIGNSADEGAFPILEDYHDTLEAVWVWSLYTKASGKQTFKANIDSAWGYVESNWKRFIGNQTAGSKSLYDCSHFLLSGVFYSSFFGDNRFQEHVLNAGNRLASHIATCASTDEREYRDPFWMTYCLSSTARLLQQQEWLDKARQFVQTNVLGAEEPFSDPEEEPKHGGPGGHDFFSKNANMALSLISCFDNEDMAVKILIKKFLPSLPDGFVSRHADENAWNAHLAMSIGKTYVLTGDSRFLKHYFAIMSELKKRAQQHHGALPRSSTFPRNESWVTFFYAKAYASVARS